ncbi:MAG: hypothetical protein P1U42_03450 [Phycisphaerales bacterium]|nr:hypothetical protein [Phycisphaerales bacterium]
MSISQSYISDNRECDRCGYNLQGLPIGGKCPECGTSIRRRVLKSSGTMSGEAPTRFVHKLKFGFILATIGIIGSIILAPMGLLFIGSLFWLAGVYLTTLPRPDRENIVPDKTLDNDRYRLIVRLMNACWPIYGLAIYASIAIASPTAPPSMLISVPIAIIRVLSGTIAWIGLIPTCVYFAELGYWASHDNLAYRLRSTAWAMAVFGVISVLLSGIAAMNIAPSAAAAFVNGYTSFLSTIAVAVFFFTVIQLTSVMRWVIKHQVLSSGSADRVKERIEREINTPGIIVTGLACQFCKFNLDGLPHGGSCPNCGESYADLTPLPVLDPAKMNQNRNEEEIEVTDGDNRGIYFNEELDALGKPKAGGTPFVPKVDIPDEGDIPLSDDDFKLNEE